MYDIYFKDDYDVNHDIINDSNGSNDVINGFSMDNVEVECKENMKCAQQKKNIIYLDDIGLFLLQVYCY